jgi:hypothetical protein
MELAPPSIEMKREQKITLGEMRESPLPGSSSIVPTTNLRIRAWSTLAGGAMTCACPTWSRSLPVRFAAIGAQTSGRCSNTGAWDRLTPRSISSRNEVGPVDIESRGVSSPCRNGSSSCSSITSGAAATYCGVADASLSINGAVWRRGYVLGARRLGPPRPYLARDRRRRCQPRTSIRDLFDDQYSRPARIIAFNIAEGWSRDVTSAVAVEIRGRYADYDAVPAAVQELQEMARRR